MMETGEGKFFFSVILSVYNVAPYIREAMNCLIAQDYGFEKIQIILVDDGSTDDSGRICDSFAQQYPNNVRVFHKENNGQSSARNLGMKYASGQWVNFLDPDDYLDVDTFSKVYQFLQEHSDETDVVSIPLFMFGSQNGPHPLNTKFEHGSRVIDIEKEWTNVQMSLASSFVRRATAAAVAFQEDLHLLVAEDAKELIKILIRKNTLGVVRNTQYHYRKRLDSSVGSAKLKKGWYTEYLVDFCQWAIDYCKAELGKVPKYVQFIIMHDLQWKLLQEHVPEGVLTDKENEEYKWLLWNVISNIDDEIILIQRNNYSEQKLLALSHKYQKNADAILVKSSIFYGFNNRFSIEQRTMAFHLSSASQNRDSIVLEGWYPEFPSIKNHIESICANLNGISYTISSFPYEQERMIVDDLAYKKRCFRISLPLDGADNYIISFIWNTSMGSIDVANLVLDNYFPVSKEYATSYYHKNGWLLQTKNNCLFLNKQEHCGISYEVAFLKEIWKKNRKGGRKAVFSRILYRILKKYQRKPIWLIADKADRADDNGEAFFKYCLINGSKDIRYKFLIGKDTSDYARLKEIGRVIPYMSMRHKLNFLMADYIISAYSHAELNNPFFEYNAAYRDLMQNCKYIFLQHGVLVNNASAGLNYFLKNISGFVTSTRVEYEVISEGYGYPNGAVWLTGLPRYDLLTHNEEKSIVIMPTWRRSLFGAYHAEDSRYDLLAGFEQSEYYKFYTQLLNNSLLLEKAKKLGYKICFVPHPTLFPYIDRFHLPAQIHMYGSDVVYREIFSKNKLLVTDYSSVAFDFSYLRKPIIYCQFETLGNYGTGSERFGYEKDGFGEVTRNVSDTVNCILEYLENDCVLKEKYRERIDGFFAFEDRHNCERVYRKITELQR